MKTRTKVAAGFVAGSLVIGGVTYAILNSNNNLKLVQEQMSGYMQEINNRLKEQNGQSEEDKKEEEAKKAAGKSNDEDDTLAEETKESSKNENLEEATYARGVYEKLKQETITEKDVPKLLADFCKKYDIQEGTKAWSILHCDSVLDHLKTFKNSFQLQNYMAVYAFTHSFSCLTNTYNYRNMPQDQVNFQLPEDNDLILKLDPRDVLCVRAYLNDYSADQILRLFGQDIPTPDEIHNSLQRVLETMQVYYLNTHKTLPLRFLFDNTKSVELERVSGLQKKIVNVNVKRDKNKLNSDDTDAVIVDAADIFFNVRMNTYAELLAASMADSFARINMWVDNGEPLILHKTTGEFEKEATNFLYIEEYDEKNNPDLQVKTKEDENNPDRTAHELGSLLDVITRGAGNREETAERCVSAQQVLINRALKAQELSVTIDTKPYILDFDKAMEKVTELLGLKDILAKGYNYSENLAILTRNRLEAAKDKIFTLAKGVKRYRDKPGKTKPGGGSNQKQRQKEEVKVEEVQKDDLNNKEKEEAEKEEEKIQKDYSDKNDKQKEDLAKKKKELEEKIKNGATWEEVKEEANQYGIQKEWVDGKVKEKQGEEKKKQKEKENKEKQKQQEEESKKQKEKEKKENDEVVNKDNDLTRGETPQPTEQPAPTEKPSDGQSYYDENPNQPIDHFSDYGDDDPYGEVIGNRVENRVRALTGNNMENLSEESVKLLEQFEKILDQKLALNAAAKGESQELSEKDQAMKRIVFPNRRTS